MVTVSQMWEIEQIIDHVLRLVHSKSNKLGLHVERRIQ